MLITSYCVLDNYGVSAEKRLMSKELPVGSRSISSLAFKLSYGTDYYTAFGLIKVLFILNMDKQAQLLVFIGTLSIGR